jgi:hypothetical protein
MTQVDPMADKYGSMSTYNYAFNDPIFWNDPLGDDAVTPQAKPPGYGEKKEEQDPGNTAPFDFGYADAANGRADAFFDMLNGGGSAVYNSITYGAPFVRYGPGDRGALHQFVAYNAYWSAFYSNNSGPASGIYANIYIDMNGLPDNSQTTFFFSGGTLTGLFQISVIAAPTFMDACNRPDCTHHMLGPTTDNAAKLNAAKSNAGLAAWLGIGFETTTTTAKGAINVINKELAKQNLVNNMLKKQLAYRRAYDGITVAKPFRLFGKVGGPILSVWEMYETDQDYRNDLISRDKMRVEQISNVIGFLPWGAGTGWSLGWEAGEACQCGPSKWYGDNDNKWFE